MSQTDQQYHENKDNYGKYQYVSLNEIIKKMNFMASDNRSYLNGTSRSTIIMHAKQCLRDLNADIKPEELAYEVTIPQSLVWPLPKDYVSKLHVQLIIRNTNTGNFELVDLNQNKNMHTAIGHLQDHNLDLLYDDEGRILEADSSNAVNHAYQSHKSYPNYLGNSPTKDMSKFSKYGDYQLDERRGIIVFSSEIAEKEVVISYISDGLQEQLDDNEVSIHKYLQKPLEDYIYYECIAPLRNTIVPSNEKERARRKFRTSRHHAVMNLADFNTVAITRAMDGATKIF